MAPDPYHRPTAPTKDAFPVGLWVIWTLAVVATALWVAWPALRGLEPLNTPRLVLMSALAGAGGLLVLTLIEIRLAPWRFLD